MEPILIHRAAAENPTRLTDLEPLHTGSMLPGPLELRINESDLCRRTKITWASFCGATGNRYFASVVQGHIGASSFLVILTSCLRVDPIPFRP